MSTTPRISELLDSLDTLCATLDEIARSKSAMIKSLVDSGMNEAAAIKDFYDTVRRFTDQIDVTVKEIRKNMR